MAGVVFLTAGVMFFCHNIPPSTALQYKVGDSTWSIPSTYDFYTNWSSSHSFQVGDSLLYEFESDLHNVMQVSIREYKLCTANNPFRVFTSGPAIVPLMETGVSYFICSVPNYCAMGQKITIITNKRGFSPSTPSAQSPVTVSDSINSSHKSPLSPEAQSSGGREFSSINMLLKIASLFACNIFWNVVLDN